MPAMPDDQPDEEAFASLGTKLAAFAATRDERERRMLLMLMLAAMDPVERMRWLAPPDLLTEKEESYLRDIGGESQEVASWGTLA